MQEFVLIGALSVKEILKFEIAVLRTEEHV